MGNVIAFARDHEDDHYERLAERYNQGLEEERRVDQQVREIERRLIAGELLVQSGRRKAQPLTHEGRAIFWNRIESLLWKQTWLMEKQRSLYRLATGFCGRPTIGA
jgi:hypothetical protein